MAGICHATAAELPVDLHGVRSRMLTDMGWGIGRMAGEDGQPEFHILTRLPNWGILTWSQRIHHRAAYGFSSAGELSMPAHLLLAPGSSWQSCAASPARMTGAGCGRSRRIRRRPAPMTGWR